MSVTAPISGPQVTAAGVPPAASSSLVAKYRGATVEDLQVSPAISVPRSMAIGAALRVALDHDYSQLPLVSDADRKLLGYVDVARLREAEATPDAPVGSIMSRFAKASPQTQYTVITPDTGLAELELFLQSHPFAFITDPNRAFVLGVATKEDLDKYADRRALHGTRDGAATPTNAGPRPSAAPAEQMSRREEEEARKDRTLAEFLRLLDNYTPLVHPPVLPPPLHRTHCLTDTNTTQIPDQVTDFYLEKVGFECHDLRLYVPRLVCCRAVRLPTHSRPSSWSWLWQQEATVSGRGKVCLRHCGGCVPVRQDQDQRRSRRASTRSRGRTGSLTHRADHGRPQRRAGRVRYQRTPRRVLPLSCGACGSE